MSDANFTPAYRQYSPPAPFRFLCQTVLPTVYDDSLSYYELLNKVVAYLNNMSAGLGDIEANVAGLYAAYNQLQEYVNTYFDSLDVQEEINSKLDEMAENGALMLLLQPFVSENVSQWLDDNITPTTPIIDKTLTISGAGADAKVTGNLRRSLEKYGVPTLELTRNSGTHNGITFTWDNNVCTVSGVNAGTIASVNNLMPLQALPESIHSDDYIYIVYTTNNVNVRFGIVLGNANNEYSYIYMTESGLFHIPEDTTQIGFRLRVEAGTSILSPATVSESDVLFFSEIFKDVESIKKQNNEYISYSWVKDLVYPLNMNDTTLNGVTFKKLENGTYTAEGEVPANTTTYADIYRDRTNFPTGFENGKSYLFYIDSSIINLRIISYISEADNGTLLAHSLPSDDPRIVKITIPNDATGFAIRLHYRNDSNAAVSINDLITVKCAIADENQMYNFINTLLHGTASGEKMLSIGNSFMSGAVWTNHTFSHLSAYNNTIYGQIAKSLSINEINVNNTMYSSTGMISPPPSMENDDFLTIITSTSLSDYDYILTQFNGADLNNNSIGTINSTDNDGTLAGAIIHLMNYIKTNNGLCRLILLSVPPYSSLPAISGQNVFSGEWSSGYSIDDLDTLMYQLAENYHFIYISWQDLEISYHYMDYADYVPGDTTARHASSESVYRALGEYAGLQVHAVNSPLALKKLI